MSSTFPEIVTGTSRPASLKASTPFDPSAPSENPTYVLSIVEPAASSFYVASGSDHTLRLFSKDSLKPSGVSRQSDPITSLKATSVSASPGGPNLCVSTAENVISIWDLRAWGKPVSNFKGKQRVPYLTCDINRTGDTLAASTELQSSDASIDIFDLRSSKILHTYTESHSDDITVLSFHPDSSIERSRILLSAGEDGLLCTYDTRGADEDDCVIGTGNMEASVAHAGWMESIPGRMSDGVWESCFAVTNMETLKLWSGSEFDMVRDYGDVREVPSLPWRPDYVIGASYEPTYSTLALHVGSQDGKVGVLSVKEEARWQLEQELTGGHSDIVRAMHMDVKNSVYVSGGEDNKICLWSADQTDGGADPGYTSNRQKSSVVAEAKARRFAPY